MIASAILGVVLLVLVPGEALWRSWSKRPRASQIHRFRLTIAKVVLLLAGLWFVARLNHIAAADLGVGLRLDRAGWMGLAIAVVVVGSLITATILSKPDPKQTGRIRANELMPQGPQELRLFLVLIPLLSVGWELLYRGYLLWLLTPIIGVAAAVIVASVSYGVAHGWKSGREGLASIVAALLFTSSYALTGSLWWLMLIHAGFPLSGYLVYRRANSHVRHEKELEVA